MNRRSFVATALAAGNLPLQAANRIDLSRISVLTDECANSPGEAIAFARQYGLKWVELRAVPGLRQGPRDYIYQPEADLMKAAQELKEARLKVSFLNTGLLKHWLPGTEPPALTRGTPEQIERRRSGEQKRYDERMADLKKALRAAEIFGVRKVRVFAFTRVPEPEKIWPEIVKHMEELAAEARPKGIDLLLENEASCNVATSAELAGIFKMVRAPNLGINWDPVNGARFGSEFPEGYAVLPKDRLGNVQMKARALIIGPDFLDWKAIYAALERDKYKGQVGLETHVFDGTLIEKAHLSMKKIVELTGAKS